MRKIYVLFFIILFLAGCTSSAREETNPNIIFKEELELVHSINEMSNKTLPEELKKEYAEDVLNELFKFAVFEDSTIEYGQITEGIGSDGKGGRTFCSKLPVDINFIGGDSAVKKFVQYFSELPNVVSIGNFDIENLEEDKYKVKTIVSFLGRGNVETLDSTVKEYSIKQNKIEIQEVDDISLRKFDISMTIRPSNSDSASITLGVVDKVDNRVYNDENSKKEVLVRFYNEGKKYYSEYKIGEDKLVTAQLNPSGNILFDILSCEVIEAGDNIGVDMKVVNNSDKKVSVKIYNDKNKRVSIESEGNVEVKRWLRRIKDLLL